MHWPMRGALAPNMLSELHLTFRRFSAAYLPGDLTPEAAPVVSALDGAGCARLPLHVSPPDSSATSTALLDGTTYVRASRVAMAPLSSLAHSAHQTT